MAIPDFQTIMLTLIDIAKEQMEHNQREVSKIFASQFSLTELEKKELLPSGRQARFD